MKLLPTTVSCAYDSDLLLLSLQSQDRLKDSRILPRVVYLCPTDTWSGGSLKPDCEAYLALQGGVVIHREPGWENGAGKPGCRIRIRNYRQLIPHGEALGMEDNDWVLNLDSDGMFWNNNFMTFLEADTEHDELGQQSNDYTATLPNGGVMQHCSGGFAFIRWSMAKRLAGFNDSEIEHYLNELLQSKVSVVPGGRLEPMGCNEDVFLSYMVVTCAGKVGNIPWLWDADPHSFIKTRQTQYSFVHLAAFAGDFLGVHLNTKRELPALLDRLGKNPWR